MRTHYSQGNEDYVLEQYFTGFVGRLLEIGAFHHTDLSNSRRLIDLGWEAVLVEPSPKCYPALAEFYEHNNKVATFQAAIGPQEGMLRFYDSAGAVATASEEHYNIWKTQQLDFEEIAVPCVTWKWFYDLFPGTYDFISIDAEGMDWSILQQIDLDETKTKVICIETTYNFKEVLGYLANYKFTNQLYLDGNNIILAKEEK